MTSLATVEPTADALRALALEIDELESLDAPFDWHAFWVGAEAGAVAVAVIGGGIALALT
ncbi:conserved hypothetical protein [Frankia canadensis]|uniref:Uncharacterized protein n=1 Tax=Frankia canadensis TaxID=1836972 RepID=A0A2I2KVF7_9ACTN|nr:daptide-type RiPP [Frankia canadensis]SNQ49636.1 conserved hypothetical protein [Frankia canadensis]SOU56926.1 conserved hypothetical protein [Frankia canadensis]